MDPDSLRTALVRGIEMARDPQNALVYGTDLPRVTTLYSRWLLKRCRICGHTFREDDRVRPDPRRADAMLHEDPASRLCCWSKERGCVPQQAPAPLCDPALRDAFLKGLNRVGQAAHARRVEIVVPRSDLIGRRCPICRHTVRAGDHVVRCPCGHDCGGVFHQDLTRHLACWETWNRGGLRTYCAFLSVTFLPDAPEADDERR